MVRWVRSLLCGVLCLCASLAAAQQPAQKIYVFGNSLIHHPTEIDDTNVPHWLAYFAAQDDVSFGLDGEWEFLRAMVQNLPPDPQWGFSNVPSAWPRGAAGFDAVGYDTILMNPTNFIQYQAPEAAYEGENPKGESPLSITSDLYAAVGQGKRFVIYEGWADMASFLRSFPPNRRRLGRYHAFNAGDYHDWYTDYAAQLQAAHPDTQIELIPVARILARALEETGLGDIPVEALYLDDAPHGAPTTYFLAAAITYAGLFGQTPKLATLPDAVHPLVETHFADFLAILAQEMPMPQNQANTEAPEAPPVQKEATEIVRGQTDAPALGMGLNGVADWSSQVAFVDVMKQARQWVGHLPGQYGGWGQQELEEGGFLDENGWPTSIPDALTKIETLTLTDFPEDATQHSGVYRLTYEGTGKVDLAGSARALRYSENEITFRFQPGDGFIGVVINDTDPNGTGDYVRNIQIVREDQIPLHEAGVVFNPEWIALIEDVRLVRFMDWMLTNGSFVETWDKRPVVEDYSFTRRGVPLELMLQLANQIGADPWFNMPHLADDDYFKAFAEQVQDGLRPGLKAYVEYSNELWNFLFPQTHWTVAQARERWGEKGEEDWMQFAGMRAAQMSKIWTDTFENKDRLVRVIATHTDWPGLEQGMLTAPLSVAEGGARPVDLFDAYAVTGYFGHELGGEDFAPKVMEWIQQDPTFALATKNAVDTLRQGSLKALLTEALPYQAKVAQEHGLELIMYEGGTHIVGHGDWTGEEQLTDFFTHLNYTQDIGAIYQELLQSWNAAGGTLFNAFVDVAKPTQWGSWGALRHLGDQTPRFEALTQYNAAGATWGTRTADDFAQGLRLTAGDAGETIQGTAYDDILLGGAGDDELIAGGAQDYLHGGEGVDHAVLPGFMEEYRFFREGKRLHAASSHGDFRLFSIETLAFAKAPDLIVSVSDFF